MLARVHPGAAEPNRNKHFIRTHTGAGTTNITAQPYLLSLPLPVSLRPPITGVRSAQARCCSLAHPAQTRHQRARLPTRCFGPLVGGVSARGVGSPRRWTKGRHPRKGLDSPALAKASARGGEGAGAMSDSFAERVWRGFKLVEYWVSRRCEPIWPSGKAF